MESGSENVAVMKIKQPSQLPADRRLVMVRSIRWMDECATNTTPPTPAAHAQTAAAKWSGTCHAWGQPEGSFTKTPGVLSAIRPSIEVSCGRQIASKPMEQKPNLEPPNVDAQRSAVSSTEWLAAIALLKESREAIAACFRVIAVTKEDPTIIARLEFELKRAAVKDGIGVRLQDFIAANEKLSHAAESERGKLEK